MPYAVYKTVRGVLSLMQGPHGDKFENIDDVLPFVTDARGWLGLDELHGDIRYWAENEGRQPGVIFGAHQVVIFSVADPVPEGVCPHCNWLDAEVGRLRRINGRPCCTIKCDRCGTAWLEEYAVARYRQIPVRRPRQKSSSSKE